MKKHFKKCETNNLTLFLKRLLKGFGITVLILQNSSFASSFLLPKEKHQALKKALIQRDQIDRQPKKEEQKDVSSSKRLYTINAIIYLSPTAWSVWVNGEKVTFEHNSLDNHLHLKALDGYSVEIKDEDKTYQLEIGQSYDATLKRVTMVTSK
jgi:hypothetical protein